MRRSRMTCGGVGGKWGLWTMKISKLFENKNPTFSFEFFPPKNADDAAQLFRRARELQALGAHFCSVTYGAGGSTRHDTVDLVCRFERELGLTAMAHLTCVGHTKQELRTVLKELNESRIDNLMCLRGDAPHGEEAFRPVKGGLSHAAELVNLAQEVGDFCIGVAGYPQTHPESQSAEEDLGYLKNKVDIGADFVTTQLFFDAADYFRFVERARRIGISRPILPGVMPILNYKQIKRIAQMCGASIPQALRQQLKSVADNPDDVLQLGVEWTGRQCEQLLSGGAPGIHFYTMNRSEATQRIFERLRESAVKSMIPSAA